MRQLHWRDPLFVMLFWIAMVLAPTLTWMLISIGIVAFLYDLMRYLANRTLPFLSIFFPFLIGILFLLTQWLGMEFKEGFGRGLLFPVSGVAAYLIASFIGSRWPLQSEVVQDQA